MKKVLPHLITALIFTIILTWSRASFSFINTHDEDDNLVSGYLMATRNYKLNKDIFSHHLPGAYLISEQIEKTFKPSSTYESVLVHRNFVTAWNFTWGTVLLIIFGPNFLWLITVVELLRASYLFSLFQAENLVIYPTIYLVLGLFMKRKYNPIVLGMAYGLIIVLLSPLWPLVLISGLHFFWMNRSSYRNLGYCFLVTILPIIYVLVKIDIRDFVMEFFGYNALTYAPMVMKKPVLYTLAAFLAPGISMFDFSFSTKMLTIQALILFLFVFGIKKMKVKEWILFGLLLGVIGFRGTPRFHNEGIDFHVLPWIIGLASLCWYKYFSGEFRVSRVWLTILLSPLLLYFYNPQTYFPTKDSAGKMVIRYEDNSEVIRYLRQNAKTDVSMLTLPAHTLLYRQTNIKPFNKFLFYLPWMEQSPVLFTQFANSFKDSLPTYIFIDSINFPYTPPKLINDLLVNYEKIEIVPGQPSIYKLKSK